MYVKDILRDKGHEVYTINQDVTLLDVVDDLVDRRCGSLVVTANGQMIGIITERDILRACAEVHRPLAETPLTSAMQRNLITASLTDDVATLLDVMTQRRIRHLPVVEQDELIGIVSIGDLVKANQAELQTENQMLKDYISS